ncbi:MAG: DUF2948 family protein [Alphaproteobacteria bacterium]|jgi:Protein of unknown function (DUF2948)|nr:DUF2948 family protein [Alphaproteobacteria bacterium]
MTEGRALRIVAEDASDLEIISSAVQDAVLKAENIKFDRKQRRMTLEINRFQWEDAKSKRGPQGRVRAILAFDTVLSVKTRAVSKADPEMVYSVLSLAFDPDEEPPGGKLSILFAGDGELALQVEAIDVTLLDSSYEWTTRHRPDHDKKRR